MSTQKQKNVNIVAVITMFFLFGMIGFVTNLAAPTGTIWMSQYNGSNTVAMLGNFMNFFAYLVMGIPAGLLLQKVGYKNTALIAVIVGFVGIGIQFLAGKFTGDMGFIVYLMGAFVAGLCVCMLNTVVNPMLDTIGGGGTKGNTLLQWGGSLNSLFGSLVPVFVGSLIGDVVSKEMVAENPSLKLTEISDINLILFIVMGIFALTAIILYFINIADPEVEKIDGRVRSPWKFRHFALGAIGIFIYVGVEVGIPGTMKFFLENLKEGALKPSAAGTVVATYWFLMLIGRLVGGGISLKVGARTLLSFVASVAIILVLAGILAPQSTLVSMPVISNWKFGMETVPVNALLFVLVGLCTSVMWGGIFNLAVNGLGASIKKASGIFMMMVVGGGILPQLQNGIVDWSGKNYMLSYIVPLLGLAYLLFYALIGSKNVEKKI